MRNIFLLLLLFITACAPKLPELPPEHFERTHDITPCLTIDLEDYDIYKPYNVLRYNNWYVFDDQEEKYRVKFLSLDRTKTLRGISEGNGPFEVVGYIELFLVGDSLYIDDYNHRKMIGVNIIGDSLTFFLKSYVDDNFNPFVVVDGDRFIESAYPTHPYLFRLIDFNAHVYSVAPIPPDGVISDMGEKSQFSLYLNTLLTISPDKRKFAWGARHFPYYGFGRILDDSLYADNYLFYSKFEVGSVYDDLVIPKNESIINVLAAVSSDSYVAFLYSDNQYKDAAIFSGNIILVYDWNGEPVLKLSTKERLRTIFYDRDRKRLIGVTEMPQGLLVEYDMNGILD